MMYSLGALGAEFLAVAVVFLLAPYASGTRHSLSRPWFVARCVRDLGLNPHLSVLAVFAAALLTSIGISLIKFPLPAFHDEFSYLLAADTFASGRITNPPHPMWMHFETFHVLMQPTYASKFFPGQGLLLALGQFLWHPIVGVWLGTALAAGLACWMLQGWFPGRWALFGGLVVACHPFIQTIWGQGYWGGQFAAIGGFLLFGALPRIVRYRRVFDSLALALGLVILMNSRPFEGLITSLVPIGVLMIWLTGRQRPPLRLALARVFLPVAAMLACAVVTIGFYNWRVTGQPWMTPYQAHQTAYHVTPVFLWQGVTDEPEYHHKELRSFYVGFASDSYHAQRTFSEAVTSKGLFIVAFSLAVLRGTLAVPLLLLPWVLLCGRRFFIPLISALLVVGASLSAQWLQLHYLAPIFPAILLLIIGGFRHLHAWRRSHRPIGRFIVNGLFLLFLLTSLAQVLFYLREPNNAFALARASVTSQLEAIPGGHLVLVRYEPGHNLMAEWVYNRAEIDEARIVWAREMLPDQNRRLLEYFDDRQRWLLEADKRPPRLSEFIE